MDVTTLTDFFEKALDQLSTVDQGLDVTIIYGDDLELQVGKKLEVAAQPYQFVNLILPEDPNHKECSRQW